MTKIIKRIALIVCCSIVLYFLICIIVTLNDDDYTREVTYIGKELSQIETDSVFCFSPIFKGDFDSLYVILSYTPESDFNENIKMDDWDKKLMSLMVMSEIDQVIIFTKNKKIASYAIIRADTTIFDFKTLHFNKGHSPNTLFKMTEDELGRKQMVLAE